MSLGDRSEAGCRAFTSSTLDAEALVVYERLFDDGSRVEPWVVRQVRGKGTIAQPPKRRRIDCCNIYLETTARRGKFRKSISLIMELSYFFYFYYLLTGGWLVVAVGL
jgi:hypothetical protein